MTGSDGRGSLRVASRVAGVAGAGFLIFLLMIVEAFRCFDSCATGDALARLRLVQAAFAVAAAAMGVGPFLGQRRVAAGLPAFAGVLVAGVALAAALAGNGLQAGTLGTMAVALAYGGLVAALAWWAQAPRSGV